MKVYVDRFEEDFVVLVGIDTRFGCDVKRELISFPLHEGDVLEAEFSENEEFISAKLLPEETEKRREKYKAMMERLRRKK